MGDKNKHIEEYLDYYYKFPLAPEYAVLIKGQWGVGKTWFTRRALDRFVEAGGKYIYVSLYGVTCYEEIETSFFQQLHPFLSSKGMALTGKIAKGLLKATLKIDFDDDGKSDASLSAQTPEIKLPEYLTDTEGFVLVFDDLERCSIKISDVLGYINHFVEHQGYKAIVIANEDEIIEREKELEESDISYRRIKEKLIGKTFEVTPDLDNALDYFISDIATKAAKELYEKKKIIIKALYVSSNYKNLRHLKQALWDFERLFLALPSKAYEKEELLVHLLQIYLVYSFEIKSGALLPSELKSLRAAYFSGLFKSGNREKEESPYRKIAIKYNNFNFHETILEESIWEDIFDKGFIDPDRIKESIFKSTYFATENTPNWVKLWHTIDLTDEEFEQYFAIVEKEFKNMEYDEIGIIKHVTGLFLWLSDISIYSETKKDIFDFSKSYISHLKDSGKLTTGNSKLPRFIENESWGGLGFFGRELPEFKEFCSYLEKKKDESRIESFPDAGQELLDFMKRDIDKYYRMLILSNHEENCYFETPVLQYIPPKDFIECFMSLSPNDRRTVGYAFDERYKFDNFNEKLKEELDWLKTIKSLLTQQQQRLRGKISGYLIGAFIEDHLEKSIAKLE